MVGHKTRQHDRHPREYSYDATKYTAKIKRYHDNDEKVRKHTTKHKSKDPSKEHQKKHHNKKPGKHSGKHTDKHKKHHKSKDAGCSANFINIRSGGNYHSTGGNVCQIQSYSVNANTFRAYVHSGWSNQYQPVYSNFLNDSENDTEVRVSSVKSLEKAELGRFKIKTDDDNYIVKKTFGTYTYLYRICDGNGRGLFVIYDAQTNRSCVYAYPSWNVPEDAYPLYVRVDRQGYLLTYGSLVGYRTTVGDEILYLQMDDYSSRIRTSRAGPRWNYFRPTKFYVFLSSTADENGESDLSTHPVSN